MRIPPTPLALGILTLACAASLLKEVLNVRSVEVDRGDFQKTAEDLMSFGDASGGHPPSTLTTKTVTDLDKPMNYSRFDTHGSWIGNSWIPPPHWRLYSPKELRQVFNHSIMVVGDSTGRRFSATLYNILNGTDNVVPIPWIDSASVIDVNKKVLTEPCTREPPLNTTNYDFCRLLRGNRYVTIRGACHKDILRFLTNESHVIEGIDTLLIANGIWETERPRDCRVANRTALIENLVGTMRELSERYNLNVIWRSSGYQEQGNKNWAIDAWNNDIINRIEQYGGPRVRYVDWGGAIRARSFGNDRIRGDMLVHYGLDARLVEVQMFANEIVNMRRQNND